MPKKTEVIYRIIMESPSEGIERSLPYVFEDKEDADDLADTLNRALYRHNYHHRVEQSVSHHMTDGNVAHKFAYQGRGA